MVKMGSQIRREFSRWRKKPELYAPVLTLAISGIAFSWLGFYIMGRSEVRGWTWIVPSEDGVFIVIFGLCLVLGSIVLMAFVDEYVDKKLE